MDRLPELIAAFLAMDHFARNVIVDSARTYAQMRPFLRPRGQLRSIPSSLDDHPASDGVGDTQEECLVGVCGVSVDEE